MKTDEQLEKINSLVEKLMDAKGTNQKIDLLKTYKEDSDIKYFLYFLYDPYVTTGLKIKKIEKDLPDSAQFYNTLDCDFISLLKKLEINNTGSYKENYLVRQFIDKHSKFKDLIIKTVTKTLKLGIQATTINKAIPNCCGIFSVMLAEKYYDAPDKYLPEGTEFILTTKLDGVRCICINEDGNPKFFSRQGQPIEGLQDIFFEIRALPDGHVYDGELLLNKQGLESKDLYRETMKVVSSDGIKKNIIFNIFDILRVEDFKAGRLDMPAKERKAILKDRLSKNAFQTLKNVDILYQGTDKSQIEYWLDKITSEGGEGVMINIADAPYECKRVKTLLKVKKFQTADVHVIDIKEGDGLNKGKLGACVVEFIGPDNKVYTCKVGSGFKLEEREYFWNHKDEILDKIIEIGYFEITKNQQNENYSLRFPTWKGIIRFDKGINDLSII